VVGIPKRIQVHWAYRGWKGEEIEKNQDGGGGWFLSNIFSGQGGLYKDPREKPV